MTTWQRHHPCSVEVVAAKAAEKETTVTPSSATASILQNKKKLMVEAALDGLTPGTNPFIKPRLPGLNAEGIPPKSL
jgi:hypothetical protein